MKKIVLFLAAIAILGLSANAQNVGQANNPCPEQPRFQPITHYPSPATKSCDRGCEQTVIVNPVEQQCRENNYCEARNAGCYGEAYRTYDVMLGWIIGGIIGLLIGLLLSKNGKKNENHQHTHTYGPTTNTFTGAVTMSGPVTSTGPATVTGPVTATVQPSPTEVKK